MGGVNIKGIQRSRGITGRGWPRIHLSDKKDSVNGKTISRKRSLFAVKG